MAGDVAPRDYEDDDEDAAALWAKFDAAEAEGRLIYSAPPIEESVRVTEAARNYLVVAPRQQAAMGLYGDLNDLRINWGSRTSTGSASASGTVQQ